MKIKMSKVKCQRSNVPRGFSLVELLVVIVIIGVLSVVSYVAIQRAQTRAMNDKMMNDLVVIANALEDFRRDNELKFPIPEPGENQNIVCYYSDATYAHECDDTAAFIQGMIDNDLLTKRYLREVPTDPRTNSRYVYGVTTDGKYYQVAGLYEREDGTYEARTVENLAKGFELPSVIRAFDSANFVTDGDVYLPYSPDHLVLSARLENINGTVTVTDGNIDEPLRTGAEIIVGLDGSADLYFSDGSESHLDPGTTLKLEEMTVKKNDKEGTVTKILLKLTNGKIWSKVARLAQGSEFNVETTTAIAGVRGTEFSASSDGIKVLSGSVEVDRNGAVSTPNPVVISDYISVSDDSAYLAHFRNVPLRSVMVPHILRMRDIDGTVGQLQIRNINYFINQVNVQRGLTEDYARRVKANRLAVYTLDEAASADAEPTYSFVKAVNITDQQIGSYTLSGLSLNTPLSIRFEDCPHADLTDCRPYLDATSAFIRPPVSIQTNADLSREDIYPNLYSGNEPLLTVTAPRFVTAGNEFNVTLNLTRLAADDMPVSSYSLDLGDNNSFCNIGGDVVSNTPSAVSATADSATAGFSVNSVRAGECLLTATATLANGAEVSGTASVRVVEGDALIIPQFPLNGDVVSNPVTFRWAMPNVFDYNAEFALMIDTYTPGPTMSVPIGHTATQLNHGGLLEGEHTWHLVISGGPETYSTPEIPFTVRSNSSIDFTGAIGVETFEASEFTFPTSDLPATLSLDPLPAVEDAPDGAVYTWTAPGLNFTEDTNKKLTAQFLETGDPAVENVITLNSSKTYSVTLSARDDVTGALLGETTKTITIVYGLPEITGIAFDQASITVNAGETVLLPNINANAGEILNLTVADCTNLYDVQNAPVITDNYSPVSNDTVTCEITSYPGYSIEGDSQTATLSVNVNIAVCGDSQVTGNEVCDDGKHCENGNSCTTDLDCGAAAAGNCIPRDFGTCNADCSVLMAVCGNGIVEQGETCDDGNTDSNDGCSADCGTVETGWTCTGALSVCTPATVETCVGFGSWNPSSSTCVPAYETCNSIGAPWIDGGCWFKDLDGGKNCDQVCAPSGLACIPDFNATDAVCAAFNGAYAELPNTDVANSFAPYMISTQCRVRNPNPDAGIASFSCEAPPSVGNRLCKCH